MAFGQAEHTSNIIKLHRGIISNFDTSKPESPGLNGWNLILSIHRHGHGQVSGSCQSRCRRFRSAEWRGRRWSGTDAGGRVETAGNGLTCVSLWDFVSIYWMYTVVYSIKLVQYIYKCSVFVYYIYIYYTYIDCVYIVYILCVLCVYWPRTMTFGSKVGRTGDDASWDISHANVPIFRVSICRWCFPSRWNHQEGTRIYLYSLDWFKGKSTGNHGFYHQI